MKITSLAGAILFCTAALAACGAEIPAPGSGAAYRALNENDRLAAATACRDRAADAAEGAAAEQLGSVDAEALRKQLDVAARGRRNFERVCRETLPFVTPGLRVIFSGATNSGDTFTYQTRSDKPLTIRGTIAPARDGSVEAHREFGSAKPFRAAIDDKGRFTLPTVRLRKVANNSFVVTLHTPPDALRRFRFSAICLDCLATP